MKYKETTICNTGVVVAFIFKLRFESSVISYGSQTRTKRKERQSKFESSVISYGSQTFRNFTINYGLFESSVISYGSQTSTCYE